MPSNSVATTSSTVTFGSATPILRVTDLPRSIAFYVDALGFKLDWSAGNFASVSRELASLMLCAGDQGNPGTWLYVGVNSADALFEQLCKDGVTVRHPPTNYPWGARELQVTDPDGNVLRFGSDSTNEPVGPWLDAAGEKWLPLPDGSWKREANPPARTSLDSQAEV